MEATSIHDCYCLDRDCPELLVAPWENKVRILRIYEFKQCRLTFYLKAIALHSIHHLPHQQDELGSMGFSCSKVAYRPPKPCTTEKHELQNMRCQNMYTSYKPRYNSASTGRINKIRIIKTIILSLNDHIVKLKVGMYCRSTTFAVFNKPYQRSQQTHNITITIDYW